MQSYDKDKLNRIEELKTKLFNKNYKTTIEHHNDFPHYQKREIADSWEEEKSGSGSEEKFFMKTSMFKKFFIFSVVFFVLALGYATYIYIAKSNTVSNNNIDISVLSNAFTAGGEEYSLLLEIVNRNNSPLELVDLVIEYPKNSEVISSEDQDNEHLRFSLGTIPAGGIKDENIKLVLYGEQGSSRQIKISLEYRVEGSNAIFVKEKSYDVSINSTPVSLSVDAPTEASPNKDITLNVKASLNSTKSVSNMLLKLDYPIGFQFVKAIPAPSSNNNVWDLGDLAPGAEYNISVTGKLLDVSDGEEKNFKVWSGSQSSSDKSSIGVVFNSAEHIVAIKKSSIEAKLIVNGESQREYAINTKSSIQGQIQWKNNLETKINNLEIRAKIYGNAVDTKTISVKSGFYNSAENSIVWDRNSVSKFIEINPGDSGSVSFSFSPLSLFSAVNGMIFSPTVNVDISIVGKQSDGNGEITEISNSESKIIRIISDLGLSTKVLYYSGSFTNTGPIPPKVEQKTTYTVVWSLSNTANNISKAEIRSTLPSWVQFVGKFSPAPEDLTYNASSREIIWNVGVVPKGTNITEKEKEVSFQIEFSPSLSQAGTMPVLINSTTLTGYDDFANVDIKVNKVSLNTRLLNDIGFPVQGGIVVE